MFNRNKNNKIINETNDDLMMLMIDGQMLCEPVSYNNVVPCNVRTTQKTLKMAKDMVPSQEVWENLGFVFTDIEKDKVLCNALLPVGWDLNETSDPTVHEIVDENDMVRGTMIYKYGHYNRKAQMTLRNRYGICSEYVGDNYTDVQIYFGNSDEKVFIAGIVNRVENASYEEMMLESKKEAELRNIAVEFGNTNYPCWRDVTAYWEREKQLVRRIKNND